MASRIHSEAEASDGRDHDAEDDGRCREGERPRDGRESGDQEVDARHDDESDDDADESAEETQQYGFDQELLQDVLIGRADGLAQADLARALGNGDEHDVHDADASHDQRDGRDGRKEERENGRDASENGKDVRLGLDGEVILGGICDAVVVLEHVRDASLYEIYVIRGVGLYREIAVIRDTEKFLLRDGRGNKNDIVLVNAANTSAFRNKHAGDAEGHVLETDILADGVDVCAKERGGEIAADDRHVIVRVNVFLRERVAFGEAHVAHGEIVSGRALEAFGHVVVAIDHVGLSAHFRHNGGDRRLALERCHVLVVQRSDNYSLRGGRRRKAAVVRASRDYENEVRAHALHLAEDHVLGRASDGHKHDHGRNADHDAEHGKYRTHLSMRKASCC